jgi:hypothetical protein
MQEVNRVELTDRVLIGLHTSLTPHGDVQLTLRYGVTMAPSEMTFQMTARQACRLAQGLLLTLRATEPVQ